MTQKVVLVGVGGGKIWHDTAPDGEELVLTTRTVYRTTGETIEDARWGTVKLYKATSETTDFFASMADGS